MKTSSDNVNHPPHYQHPSGVEAYDICQYLDFSTGNAFKYLFRHRNKGTPLEDLRKCQWYLQKLTQYDFDRHEPSDYFDDETRYVYKLLGRIRDTEANFLISDALYQIVDGFYECNVDAFHEAADYVQHLIDELEAS